MVSERKNEAVKEALLVSIVKRSNVNPDFKAIIVKRFERDPPDSSLRRKLLAASEVTPIYIDLKSIDTRDRREKSGLIQYGLGFDQNSPGGIYLMTQNNVTIHGDVNAQNFSAGDMIGSANGAVQNIQANRSSDKEVLAEILRFLENAAISESHKAVVAEKVKAVADTPSQETKRSLFGSIKQIAEAASITGGAIEGLDKIVEIAGSFLS